MKKILGLILLLTSTALAAGRIQNEDIKSSAELVSAGSDASHLPNDTKVYVTSLGKTLSAAIIDGTIAAATTPTGLIENLVLNPFFESSATTSWTTSGSAAVSGAYAFPSVGNKYFSQITASVSGGYFQSTSVSMPTFISSGAVVTSYDFRSVSGTWQADLFVNGSSVASQTITSGSVFRSAEPMLYAVSQTTGLATFMRFTAVASSAVLQLDNVSVSKAEKGKAIVPMPLGIPVWKAAQVSATGAVNFELGNDDWIISCTNANPKVCDLRASVFASNPICIATNNGAGGRVATIIAAGTTVLSIGTDPGTYDTNIICFGYR